MSTANKTIAINFYKEQDRLGGRLSDALTAPDYRVSINGGPPITRTEHEEMARIFWTAFPDIEQSIEETISEGNSVAVRFTMRATHVGDFMGTASTGKRIEVSGMGFLHIVDGKVAEFRETFDVMGMMEQIGALPAPQSH